MSRSKAREEAMQLIFQMDAQKDFTPELKEKFFQCFQVNDSNQGYINIVHNALCDHKDKIDELINKYSSWKVVHMSKIDLAILRLAIVEMIYVFDVPAQVAINEAVNLAKEYGDDHSPAFINGVLASVFKEIEK